MKTSFLLIALVAGGVAGTGSAFLVGSSVVDKGEPHVAATPGGGPTERIEDLIARNDELERRLSLLESQLEMETNCRDDPSMAAPVEVSFNEGDLLQLLASLEKPDQPPPAGLQRMVERAIEDKQDRERSERELEEQARREERLDERMAEMAEKLGLDMSQQETVRTALWTRDQERGELMTKMRETMRGGGPGGGSMDDMRAAMQGITDRTNVALQASLSPSQFEQYQEEYPDRSRGWGGRGGGGGDSRRGN